MESRSRDRKPFIRRRSPTPPWLKEWKIPSRNLPVRRPHPYDVHYKEIEVHGLREHDKEFSDLTVQHNPLHARYEEKTLSVCYNSNIEPNQYNRIDDSKFYFQKRSRYSEEDNLPVDRNDDLPFMHQEDVEDEEESESFADDDFSTGVQFTGRPKPLDDKEKRRGRGLYCSICDVGMCDIEQYQSHLLGTKHKKMLRKKGIQDESGSCIVDTDDNSEQKLMRCIVCNDICISTSLGPHIASQKHINAETDWRKVGQPIPKFKRMFVEVAHEPDMKVVNNYCKVCDIHTADEVTLFNHCNSRKHAWNVLKTKSSECEDKTFFCDVCGVTCVSNEELKAHFLLEEHVSNVTKKAMQIAAANPLPGISPKAGGILPTPVLPKIMKAFVVRQSNIKNATPKVSLSNAQEYNTTSPQTTGNVHASTVPRIMAIPVNTSTASTPTVYNNYQHPSSQQPQPVTYNTVYYQPTVSSAQPPQVVGYYMPQYYK